MLKAYEYRLYPNKEQKILFAQHFGCTRFVYNWALNLKIKAYQQNKTTFSCFELMKEMTLLKHENKYNWLLKVDSQSLQQSIRCLDNAFTRFFREKKGFPKFKSKKNNRKSYSIPQRIKIDFESNKIYFPKFKNGVNIKLDRIFEGKIKTCTIKQTPTNKYFISILVETTDVIPQKPKIEKRTSVGIDLGIKDFAILSTGEKIANQRNLKQLLPQLKVLQKRASKKQIGSNNRKKANLKVALIHEKIANRRKDFLHKLSHRLTHDNQVNTLCLETLNVSGMMKNHKLAQAISDVSWNEFNRQLEYKTEWYGKNLLRIGRFEPSSKICNNCGYIKNDLTLSDRNWVCPDCSIEHDRDINASKNIKKFALQTQNLVYTGLDKSDELVELSA